MSLTTWRISDQATNQIKQNKTKQKMKELNALLFWLKRLRYPLSSTFPSPPSSFFFLPSDTSTYPPTLPIHHGHIKPCLPLTMSPLARLGLAQWHRLKRLKMVARMEGKWQLFCGGGWRGQVRDSTFVEERRPEQKVK